jgi:hypothetical protein
MSIAPINTLPIEQFIQQVKAAESSNSKEIRIDAVTAKTLAFTLGIIMSRLHGDLEKFVCENSAGNNDEVIKVELNGGFGWK